MDWKRSGTGIFTNRMTSRRSWRSRSAYVRLIHHPMVSEECFNINIYTVIFLDYEILDKGPVQSSSEPLLPKLKLYLNE